MTDPQVWTLIGVFAASMFSVLGLISTMFTRIVRTEIGGLRAAMNARFDAMNVKFDALDRDVQAIARRVFPE